MPLQHYGVLKGNPVAIRHEPDDDHPHMQVRLLAGDTSFRIAINVRSRSMPPELLFLVDQQFHHPINRRLGQLPLGFTRLPSHPGGIALDYVRGNLLTRAEMRPLPSHLAGPHNDLSDHLEHYVQRAIHNPQALVYAFGERWGPEPGQADPIFGFRPGNGIHNIHMNQGNRPAHQDENGTWQDGGLLIHFSAVDQWIAIFLAFQSQAWHTEDHSGAGSRRSRGYR
jgi:uncharacterized protein YukJ